MSTLTGVLDYVSRGIHDDIFFPYTCTSSWFAPDGSSRSIPFTPMLQTLPYRGAAGFGQSIVVDLDNRCGDYLHAIILQIQLDNYDGIDWEDGIGYNIIDKARIEIGEVIVEEIDRDFTFIALNTFPDSNMSRTLSPLIQQPTDDGRITCILPFWFSRIPYKESLPLVACEDGTVRLRISFRNLAGKDELFREINVVTYSSVVSGPLRDELQRNTLEHIYRPMQSLVIDNPIAYSYIKSNVALDATDITIPLPFNGPVEELFWVVRRHDSCGNNTPYGDGGEPVLHSKLTINGSPIVSASGQWFRSHIATLHRGGIIPYNSYIYGYSFARQPGEHSPSGSANFSRTHQTDLTLTLRSPGSDHNWKIYIYAVSINWLRFENGMCGRVFST